MALVLSEGFDQYTAVGDLAARFTTSAASGYSGSGGKFGGGAYTTNNDDLPLVMPLDAVVDADQTTGAAIHAAFWFKASALPAATDVMFSFAGGDGGTELGSFALLATGAIQHRQWNFSSVAATTAAVIVADTFHHIEVAVVYGNAGTCKIWVDGIQVMDFSGDNYFNGTLRDSIGQFRIYGSVGITQSWDDMLVWSEVGTDFVPAQLGEHQIETIVPDGDSAVQFTPTGTGTTNADRVDETGIDDGDTTYVESSTVGHVDLYTMANQAVEPLTTFAIAVHSRAKKTDVGTVNLHNRIKHGTTTLEGADRALTNAYLHHADYFGKNPDTAAAWGTADVDSLLAGFEYQA